MASKTKTGKRATGGERIALDFDSLFLNPARTVEVLRTAKATHIQCDLARRIDALVRRAVRKATKRAWDCGVHWERHMARQEKWATDAAAQIKNMIESETGAKL